MAGGDVVWVSGLVLVLVVVLEVVLVVILVRLVFL